MSMENVTPTPPPPPPCPTCPTCGNKMTLTGLSPTCETVIYDYVCGNDGDCISWRPRRVAANSRRNQLAA
jgi:hypothetical protein